MQKIDFYKNLEKLYKKACRQKRIEIALKIRQLQAKILGFLVLKERKIPKLSELTDEEIDTFLQESEQIS